MKQVVLDWFMMCNRSEAGKVEFYATGLNLQAAERLQRKPAVCLDMWLHWMWKTVVTGLTCMIVPSNKSKMVGWLLTQIWVAVIASVWWRHVMFSTELDCRLLLETQERRRRTSKHAAGVHPIIKTVLQMQPQSVWHKQTVTKRALVTFYNDPWIRRGQPVLTFYKVFPLLCPIIVTSRCFTLSGKDPSNQMDV